MRIAPNGVPSALAVWALALGTTGCTCAASHGVDAGSDASRDAGRDAGVDAARDAGRDAGRDGGPDAGPRCAPNPVYFWYMEAGFPLPDGGVGSYCRDDIDCRLASSYPDNRRCYDGVCCNGVFDRATCTCSCGSEPECLPGWTCCPQRHGEPVRCTRTTDDCYIDDL